MIRLRSCPCFTLRQIPPAAPSLGAALLMRAGYWLPAGGETPLGAALRQRLRAHWTHAWGLDASAWAVQPPSPEPLAPRFGPGSQRLRRVLAWGRAWLTSPKCLPRTLAWEWPAERGPYWGVYRWAWHPEPWPALAWGRGMEEVPWGPGWDGMAYLARTERGPEGLLPGPRWAREGSLDAPAAAQVARPPADAPQPERIATPGARTIAALADDLDLPPERILKTLFWVARVPTAHGWEERPVAALLPGDRRLNPWALAVALQASDLRAATDAEMRAWGAEPGFASPVGLDSADLWVVLDAHAAGRGPWIMGANQPDAHLRQVWPGRDFPVHQVAALSAAEDAAAAAHLVAWRGRVPETWLVASGVQVDTAQGRRAPALQWAEVDAAAWAVALAEAHHDAHGLVWPLAWAPAQVHLVLLRPRRAGAQEAALDALADEVAHRLETAGQTVWLDDRDLSPGVKFTDADLMGLPWRVVVSPRHLAAHTVEIKRRGQEASALWPVEELPTRMAQAQA